MHDVIPQDGEITESVSYAMEGGGGILFLSRASIRRLTQLATLHNWAEAFGQKMDVEVSSP